MVNKENIDKVTSDDSFSIINNFINQTTNKVINYEYAYNELNRISNFFKLNSFKIDYDLILKLLKENKKLLKIVKIIISKIYNDNLKIEHEFKDELIIDILNIYMDLENLENSSEIEENDNSYYSEDSIDMYLKEISKYKVLSIEEEKELYQRIVNGDKDAKTLLINSNLKLVVSFVKKYLNKGLSFEDLIQEGNMGLMKAVEHFDPKKGSKFSTYAAYWIKQAITRAIADKARVIRIPNHLLSKISKYRKIKNKLTIELKREPSLEELAKELNVSVKKIEQFERLLVDTVSINTKVDDSELEIEYIVPDNEEEISNLIESKIMNNELKNILKSCLTKKEENVLILRFGLLGDEPKTLEEIGKIYGYSRERIRQIETKALRKLKNSEMLKNIISTDSTLKVVNGFSSEEVSEIFPKKETLKEDNISTRIYELLNDISKYLTEKEFKAFILMYKFPIFGLNVKIFPEFNSIPKKYLKKLDDVIIDKIKDKEETRKLMGYNSKLKIRINNCSDSNSKNINKSENSKEIVDFLLNNNFKVDENLFKVIDFLSNTYLELNEIKVLILRYFVLNNKTMSLEIIGKYLNNITRERVRQIEKEALDKLELLNKKEELFKYQKTEEKKKVSNNELEVIKGDLEKYSNILKLIKTPILFNLIKKLSIKEEIIITLIFGEVDNKYFDFSEIANFFSMDQEDIIDILKKIIKKYQERFNSFLNKVIKIEKENYTVDEKEYNQILNLLKMPLFNEYIKTLTDLERVVVCQKLNCSMNKSFTNKQIANFYNISEEEVNQIIYNVLNVYKNSFNKLIERLIIIIDKEKEFVKKDKIKG